MNPDPAIFYILYPGDTKERGPHTLAQLRAMWKQGTVSGDTLYSMAGMKEWEPLAKLRNLEEQRQVKCDHCGRIFMGPMDVPMVEQECPSCGKVPVDLNKEAAKPVPATAAAKPNIFPIPSWMGIVGALLLPIGIIGLLYFMFVFDVARAHDGGRVVNIGLTNDRLVGATAFAFTALIGAVFLAAQATMETVVRVLLLRVK